MERRSKRQNKSKDKHGNGSAKKFAPFIIRKIGTFDILDEESLVSVEQAADTILSDVGAEIRNDPISIKLFKDAGADVKGERVRFDKGMCRSIILKTAPSEFSQYARNRERTVKFGGDNIVFSPGYGAPFVSSSDTERRYATMEDFNQAIRLSHISPYFHHTGGTVCEPTDVDLKYRHLEMVRSHIIFSDKPFMGSVTSEERATDSIRLTEIVFGKKFVSENCCTMGLININSPLVLDGTMLGALRAYASANQCCVVTPFVIGAAAGPMSPAGILSQALAEVLVGLSLTQLVKPGSPAIFGYLSTGLNMKSGAPVRYDETWKCFLAAGQLARRLRVPLRCGSSTTSAKAPDYQGGLETALNFQNALMAGTNFFIHASGQTDGGLCLDLDKLILDCDMLGMAERFVQGIDTKTQSFCLDDIKEVGPGGNFFTSKHTLNNYRTGFYSPDTFDSLTYEQWAEDGKKNSIQRAAIKRKSLLEEYEEPPIEITVKEALGAFIERRRKDY